MAILKARFSKEINPLINDFNSSISFDHVMYKEDIKGSIAHATMLCKTKIISESEKDQIVDGLTQILSEIDAGTLDFDPNAEDIHMFIEQTLTDRIGNAGKRLHTARSRNDQVALDIRMYLKGQIEEIRTLTFDLIKVIVNLAEENTTTIMPGYTHLQVAQPITFAHHIMAYAQMFERDMERLSDTYKRTNYCPLGSGALAGTTFPIDRAMTAELLGFYAPTENSMDSVSDRDFCVELASTLSILMMHLSRLSEEIIIWCSSEFKYVELDDAFATGSSIMPQKKNPDITELIRGKTGRVYGNLQGLLTVLKGLPLAYNKDMQEDKEAIFDSVKNVTMCLKAVTPMLDTMTVRSDNMKNSARRGFINATDCADYLVKKGLAFRDAYNITGALVQECIAKSVSLDELSLEEYKAHSDIFETDIFHAIDLNTCLNERSSYGGPSEKAVKVQISNLKNRLDI